MRPNSLDIPFPSSQLDVSNRHDQLSPTHGIRNFIYPCREDKEGDGGEQEDAGAARARENYAAGVFKVDTLLHIKLFLIPIFHPIFSLPLFPT